MKLLQILHTTAVASHLNDDVSPSKKERLTTLMRVFDAKNGLAILKQWLDDAGRQRDIGRQHRILSMLPTLPMSMTSVVRSRITGSILDLRRHRDETVASAAKGILKQWREQWRQETISTSASASTSSWTSLRSDSHCRHRRRRRHISNKKDGLGKDDHGEDDGEHEWTPKKLKTTTNKIQICRDRTTDHPSKCHRVRNGKHDKVDEAYDDNDGDHDDDDDDDDEADDDDDDVVFLNVKAPPPPSSLPQRLRSLPGKKKRRSTALRSHATAGKASTDDEKNHEDRVQPRKRSVRHYRHRQRQRQVASTDDDASTTTDGVNDAAYTALSRLKDTLQDKYFPAIELLMEHKINPKAFLHMDACDRVAYVEFKLTHREK